MATWESAFQGNANLLNDRKYMFGSVLFNDYGTSGLSLSSLSPFASDGSLGLTAVTSASGTSWIDVGALSADGVTFPRSIAGDDDTIWQSREVARHDVTGDTSSAQFTVKEVKRATLALTENMTLAQVAAITPTVSGGLRIDKPSAQSVYRSMLFIGVDGTGAQANLLVRLFYRCSVTDIGDAQAAPGTPWQQQVTVTAYPDPSNGNKTVSTWFGGPALGTAANLAALL